jgi:hypothetical protein
MRKWAEGATVGVSISDPSFRRARSDFVTTGSSTPAPSKSCRIPKGQLKAAVGRPRLYGNLEFEPIILIMSD